MIQEGKMKFGFEEGGFNQPRMVVDVENYRKKQNERTKDNNLDFFRDDIKVVQKETEKRYEEKRDGSYLFVGPEICGINLDDLEKTDLALYGQFKDFKRNKMSTDDFICVLEEHRSKLSNYQSFILDKKPNYDFSGDSRTEFLAWLQNKLIEEQIRRMRAENRER